VLPPPLFEGYLADILDLESRDRAGELLVAEHDGWIVGAVTYYPDAGLEGLGWPSGWAGLRALGVEPPARGLGVGSALLRACRQRALAEGAPVLCLHTAEFMRAAVAMYEAMGFRRVPEFDFDGPEHFQLPGDHRVTVIAYRLDLDAVAAASG
jgi:GNAT superfamily N-acetyltransferase